MDIIHNILGGSRARHASEEIKDIHDEFGGSVSQISLERTSKVLAAYCRQNVGDQKYYQDIEDLFEGGDYTGSQESFLRKCCGLELTTPRVALRLSRPIYNEIFESGSKLRRMGRKKVSESIKGVEYNLTHRPIINHFTGSSDGLKISALRGARIAYGLESINYNAVEKVVAGLAAATLFRSLGKEATAASISKNSGNVIEPYPNGHAKEKLDNMIGLSEIKREIAKLSDYVSMLNLSASNGQTSAGSRPNLNLFFGGNPGTGKTEVARLYGSLLRDAGILEKGHVVSTTRSDLIGEYVGKTGPKTREVIAKALGGVLFVDEAHSLITEAGMRDFASEAVSELMVAMVDHKGKFAVVFATYESKREHFLAIDVGLRRRIAKQLAFPDYSDRELTQILKLKASQQGYLIAENVAARIGVRIGERRGNVDFGNGGDVETALEAAIRNYATRFMEQVRAEQGEDEGRTLEPRLILQDFEC